LVVVNTVSIRAKISNDSMGKEHKW